MYNRIPYSTWLCTVYEFHLGHVKVSGWEGFPSLDLPLEPMHSYHRQNIHTYIRMFILLFLCLSMSNVKNVSRLPVFSCAKRNYDLFLSTVSPKFENPRGYDPRGLSPTIS
jgi:hypothetical protein